ncbi:hypothetical protein HELRODRAFT_85549, partial [Helobdella robusta]|uniref:Carboxylesterase type B domain-containing protein n=1 Tax=Helobdella robusta TaxID=6412 RepID=T1G5Z0_HELRO
NHVAGNLYDGSLLAAHGKVIVITLNYRLGLLGFFSTMDSHSPGNLALHDLTAALLWLHHNIRNFRGDRNMVTLMGHGYGASLVHLLMISTVNMGGWND